MLVLWLIQIESVLFLLHLNHVARELSVDEDMKFHVIVVGGGPSGAYSALHLAKSGFKVLVLERLSRGRYKACAGGISLRALSLLPSIPSEVVERNIFGTRMYSPSGKELSGFSSERVGCTVYRTKFDSWLMGLAEAEGALIKDTTSVERIVISESGVNVKAREKSGYRDFCGDIFVGAFGVEPSLHRQLGLHPPKCVISAQIELAMNKEAIDKNIGDFFEHYYSSEYTDFGYVWLFPKREGITIGLADKIDSKGLVGRLKSLVKDHPIIKEKVKGSRSLCFGGRSLYVHLIPHRPLDRTYGRRFLLVGDAAGFANAFSGEGISYALSSGKVAAKVCGDALEKDDLTEKYLEEYQSGWKKAFGKDLERGLTLQRIFYGANYDEKWDSLIEFLSRIKRYQPKPFEGII